MLGLSFLAALIQTANLGNKVLGDELDNEGEDAL